MRESAEDRTTVDYLRDTCVQAGGTAPFLYVDEIGWNGQRFVDMQEAPIAAILLLFERYQSRFWEMGILH